MKRLQLTGQRFGRLFVIEESHRAIQGVYWKCKCDCGKEITVVGKALKSRTRSCGCLTKEKSSINFTTHGMSDTREYAIWCGIKSRCNNKNRKGYKKYGARGIKICKRWEDDFMAFFSDMGVSPFEGATVERVDNKLSYSKENCKWGTYEEQARNRGSNKFISHNGETKVLQEWSNILGVDHANINYWLKRGKPFEWVYDYFMSKKIKKST